MRIPLGTLMLRKDPRPQDGGSDSPPPPGGKLGRDVFLYLHDGRDYPGDFGQCSSCRLWVIGQDLCSILGPMVEATAASSCGAYVPGMPGGHSIKESVSPEEVGFVRDRPVRCENCISFTFERKRCEFFEKLNESLPELFDLDCQVMPKACCNGFRPALERPKAA